MINRILALLLVSFFTAAILQAESITVNNNEKIISDEDRETTVLEILEKAASISGVEQEKILIYRKSLEIIIQQIKISINNKDIKTSERIRLAMETAIASGADKSVVEIVISVAEKYFTTVDTINKDGKNVNYVVKFSETAILNENFSLYTTMFEYIDTLTLGVLLFPNTWQIELSYGFQVGTDMVNSADDTSSNDQYKEFTGKYVVKDSDKKQSLFEIYTKPISGKYGQIGVGYKNFEKREIVYATFNNVKVLDYKHHSNDEAAELVAGIGIDYTFAVVHESQEKLYLSYNLPPQNAWYDGIGFSMGKSKSSYPHTVNNHDLSIVLKPDIDSTFLNYGINKTFDEIDSWISFRKLLIGQSKSKISFYNYDTKSNESISVEYETSEFEIVLMKKFSKGRKVFFIFNNEQENSKSSSTSGQMFSTVFFEIGTIF